MAIPVHLQQFKAAGVYRVVFDKSTILNEDTSILRLVVGYSEIGPFNVPVYVKDPQEFISLFGNESKKLEKRGIWFHKLALQMLRKAPILCLNLKKFENECVKGASISTDFNPKYEIIDTVTLKVEDIYDTTRFWNLEPAKLNDLHTVDGSVMDQYINLTVINTNSVTYFIRKASGRKVSGYNITVNDWYSNETMPEYMEKYKSNLISDFFAEIYVFKGKFTAQQVLASSTLKNYFIVKDAVDEDGDQVLQLRKYVLDAYGDPVDTLDMLYSDETSNALGHWVGCLIPYFQNKQGTYEALDIVFNSDSDIHHMMMSFNIDLLEEEEAANIDLSGRMCIVSDPIMATINTHNFQLDDIYAGNGTTSVLGNNDAPIISDTISFGTDVYDAVNKKAFKDLYAGKTKITGTLYIVRITNNIIVLKQIGSNDDEGFIEIECPDAEYAKRIAQEQFKVQYDGDTPVNYTGVLANEIMNPFEDPSDPLNGPVYVVTSIARVEPVPQASQTEEGVTKYYDQDMNLKATIVEVNIMPHTTYNGQLTNNVYGSSISFIKNAENWQYGDPTTDTNLPPVIEGSNQEVLYCKHEYDKSLLTVLKEKDALLADDGTIDANDDQKVDNADKDGYYDLVFVQGMGTKYDDNGVFQYHYVLTTGKPKMYTVSETIETYDEFNDTTTTETLEMSTIVRVDAALNQEIGTMIPQYLQGYTYEHSKPVGTGMYQKLQWQKFILSTLTDYKGLRTGLLNKSEIDYRYIIDTFESYPDSSLKNVLSYLTSQKQSALFIGNFPSVQNFIKCPYASFTDSKGVFDVNYVIKGCNKKKGSSISFSLPDETEGASFAAFYTPLKFSDGYIDTIVPSAGLVSNLFIEKYNSRQPYYIIAGPNYGSINASGLIGPDYKYSIDELQIIEPYGVNVMVYRPSFGTFINANQTAKQTPKSALSYVNVRELVIYLQDEIGRVLQQYQWEINSQRTRNAILDRANQICEITKANDGLYDYLNIMDESNNTPELIDNEFCILSTAIEPGKGAGKMVHELTIYRTGKLRATIKEA